MKHPSILPLPLPTTTLFATTLFTLSASAAVPLKWTVETSRAVPATFEAYSGETLAFEASLQSYGKPLEAPLNYSLYWQTNGMGNAWWSVPCSQTFEHSEHSNILFATWSPTNDVGARAYNCFIGQPGTIYHAAFQLRLRPSPGATPNELPLPQKVIDFAKVTVLNPPWSDGGGSESETNLIRDIIHKTVDGAARPLPRYLHALDFADSYPEAAAEYYRSRNGGDASACASVRDGNTYSRNFDFPFDDRAEFVVKMAAGAGRFASVGVAQVGTNLTEAIVTSGKWSKWYKSLPGATVDGINEHGVVCNINVVDGDPHEAGWPTTGEIHCLGAVRCVLDTATNAASAASVLAAGVYFPSGWHQNYHYMIADAEKTFIVENGAAHEVTGRAVMTNFRLYPTHSTGAGQERYALLEGGANITNAWYTRCYSAATNPKWVSEFGGDEATLDAAIAYWATKPKEAHRGEIVNGQPWWQSIHTSIYDISNRVLRVAVQEVDDWYTFQVPASGNGGGVDEGKVREIVEPMIVSATNGVAYQVTTEPIPANLTNKVSYTRQETYEGETRGEDEDGSVVIGKGAVGTVDPNYIRSLTNATKMTYLRSMSVAIGQNAKARADNSASAQAIAIGANSKAEGANAISIGAGSAHWHDTDETSSASVAKGSTAIALGYQAKALASGAVQIGAGANDTEYSLKFRGTYIVRDGIVPAVVDHLSMGALTNANGGAFVDLKDDVVEWINGGNEWTQVSGVKGMWRSLAYDSGLFCAGSYNNGGIIWSNDGIKWSQTSVTNGKFYAICPSGNGRYVAANYNDGGLWYSGDGITWEQSSVTNGNWYALGYGNGRFIAGSGDKAGIWYSDDGGMTWTQSEMTGVAIFALTFGNGLFIAAQNKSNSGLWYSDDGVQWAKSAKTTGMFRSLCFVDGRFVAGGSSVGIWYSDDGTNWVQSAKTDGLFSSIGYGHSRFVAGAYSSSGSNPGIWYSDDFGTNWVQSAKNSGAWCSVAYGNGRYVYAQLSGSGFLWRSDDTITRAVPVVQKIKVNGTLVEADSNNVVSIEVGGGGGVDTNTVKEIVQPMINAATNGLRRVDDDNVHAQTFSEWTYTISDPRYASEEFNIEWIDTHPEEYEEDDSGWWVWVAWEDWWYGPSDGYIHPDSVVRDRNATRIVFDGYYWNEETEDVDYFDVIFTRTESGLAPTGDHYAKDSSVLQQMSFVSQSATNYTDAAIAANEKTGEDQQIVRGRYDVDGFWDIMATEAIYTLNTDYAEYSFEAESANTAGFADQAKSNANGEDFDDAYARKEELVSATNGLIRIETDPKWTAEKSGYVKFVQDDRGKLTAVTIGSRAVYTRGISSLVNGESATASGEHSHAEGYNTYAGGFYSHAEGQSTRAENNSSHAEGSHSHAKGYASHAEGHYSSAEGNYSHADGHYARTGDGTNGHHRAFTWQGVDTTTYYNSHGDGTFNLNPVGGLSGFWIGETNMKDHINNAVSNLVERLVNDALRAKGLL